jgi:hypothetical protein
MVRKMLLAGLAALVTFGVVRWQLAGRFVEEPNYVVERRIGDVEIRVYDPAVRAETVVTADSSEAAANMGFRRLARYIFGGNRAGESVPMTAPVTQEVGRGESIAMTAPVTQTTEREGVWRVTFTMPRGRTLAELPTPVDPAVSLRSVPAQRVAVLRYSGTTPPARVAEKERELRDALASAGIEARGTALSARYDPPSTLPVLRRNEVWIAID